MKSLKLQISGLAILAAVLMIPVQSMAQWSIGATYEIRQEEPKNGYGIRIERDILQPIPIIDIGLRAHFSFFNDENSIDDGQITISNEITAYDYGLAAVGGVSIGFLKPYIGLGIGASTFDIDFKEEIEGEFVDDSESAFFWSGFVGAQLTAIPKLHPFIEYRFEPTDEPDFVPSSDGRIIFGISLSF